MRARATKERESRETARRGRYKKEMTREEVKEGIVGAPFRANSGWGEREK